MKTTRKPGPTARPRRRRAILTLYTMEQLGAFVALIRGEAIDPAKLEALAAHLDTTAEKLTAAVPKPGA